jgi:hypothetical protein
MHWLHGYVNIILGCGQSLGKSVSRTDGNQQRKSLWTEWMKNIEDLEGRILVVQQAKLKLSAIMKEITL